MEVALLEFLSREGYHGDLPTTPSAVSAGARTPAAVTRPPVVKLPYYGRVSAGPPTEAADPDADEAVDLNDLMGVTDGTGRAVISVSGHSLSGLGIQDGDRVVIRLGPAADVGDLVLADIEGRTLMKKVAQDKRAGRKVLVACYEGAKEKPIPVEDGETAQVLGRLEWSIHRI